MSSNSHPSHPIRELQHSIYRLFIKSGKSVKCRVPGLSLGLRQTKLVWPILLLLLVGAVLTALLPSAEDHGPLVAAVRRAPPPQENRARGDGTEEEQRFTIIIQTYNRTDVLLKLLNHYQALPHLHQIIIVWNNVGEQTPLKLWNSLGPHPVPVVFKEQASNLMRNRLQPFPEIVTDGQFTVNLEYFNVLSDFNITFYSICSSADAWWRHPAERARRQLCFLCLEGNKSKQSYVCAHRMCRAEFLNVRFFRPGSNFQSRLLGSSHGNTS